MTPLPASPRYAKLSRPRLHDALPRPRLFAAIDALRERHAAIWLAAPPGAGKTTLAASYLSARGLDAVWCQVDPGDADPATLFHYLGEAVRGDGPALPWLAPELAGDVPRFARLFFRDFFARLPVPSAVVLDNLHELSAAQAAAWIEIAAAEVPDGVTLMILSRDPPPARLARLELAGRLAVLGWDALRLDDREMRSLAQVDDGGDERIVAWLDRLDGWAAGVAMLRDHLARQPGDAAMPLLEGRDAVFRYFAGEILERMPTATQHTLLALALLPGASAEEAAGLTGNPEAGRLLDQLYHSRLFVDRRGAGEPVYHFHALFREFLRHELGLRLPAAERAALFARAAQLLERHDRPDDAARLYEEARDWPALAALLLRRADAMLAAGRGETWREWFRRLPPELVDAQHWLRYWYGVSLCHVDPPAGRAALEDAFRGFGAAGACAEQMLCAAAVVDAYYYEWADLRALPGWIDAMQEGIARLDLAALEPEQALILHSRLGLALQFVAPDRDASHAHLTSALALLDRVQRPADRLMHGAILLHYANWVDDPDVARQLVAALDPLADLPEIGPFHRVWWRVQKAFRMQLDADYAAAQRAIDEAGALAAHFGLEQLTFELQHTEISGMILTGRLDEARRLLDDIQRTLKRSRRLYVAYLHQIETMWHAFAGNGPEMLREARAAIRVGAECGLPALQQTMFDVYLAYACAQNGLFEESLRCVDDAIAYGYAGDKAFLATLRDFLQAYALLMQGDEDAAAGLLRATLAEHRARQAKFFLRPFPAGAAALAGLALRHGIETDHVRGIIVRQRLTAPDRSTADWPWPVAVRSFGKFAIALHGEPAAFGRKAQQRPLALLKALLAAGEGGRQQQALGAQLWPDADDARAALNVTVHRLRKLLGSDDAVLVADGRTWLNPALVWSDVAALGALCERIEALGEDTSCQLAARCAADLLALYRGPFCDGDEEAWLLPVRERWRNRFVVAAGHLGKLFEARGDSAGAQQLYLRGLEVEPLAETFYRNLMRCAHAQGDPAAAFSAYRRCREMLSILLGRAPAPETERLAVELGLK